MNVRERTGVGVDRALAGDPALIVVSVGRKLEAALNDALSQDGSSLARVAVLQAVAESDSAVGLKELAAVLGCSKSNASALVERMQRDHLLVRAVDPKDQRGVLLSPTPDGDRVLRAGLDRIVRRQEGMLSDLDSGERDTLARLLARITP